ncbi:multicopper oxidase domain protein [Salix suchowensis]|nr:multicopper oxidase domain protein [Salix suchowensis]
MYSDAAKDMAFSPIPPIGSPYPYPFSHVRRANTYAGQIRNPPPPSSTGYDPTIHPYSRTTGQAMADLCSKQPRHISDSTLSPSSTPYPGGAFIPWAYLHTKKMLGIDGHDPEGQAGAREEATTQSGKYSAARHQPGALYLRRGDRWRRKIHDATGRHMAVPKYPPPTAGGVDDDADWIDEDDDPDDDDLLELEYHPSFIKNVEKRRRRWDARWEALVQSFQALDRQTDATLVLLAAPSHSSSKMYSITSRSIRRQPAWRNSPAMANLRSNFRHIAVQRRATRVQRPTLADRLLAMPTTSSSGGDGSDGSNESREEDLKRALGTALGSLGALGTIYEQREARWKDEMRRIGEDRERWNFY